ncbi:putative acetylesterase domain protein [Burkholderia pseudomallei]|nr:putative acetylesterase domain protein [Burkholderia pseudomallei]
MDITRRSLLGAALAGALDTIAPAAHAQAAARGAAPPDDAPRAVPDETIPARQRLARRAAAAERLPAGARQRRRGARDRGRRLRPHRAR